ncbi:glycosyltransferase family 2 protein [Lysobacter sp. TY2-98]|uniref:glycosyltransferase family 2 protein n=1 Tax=Lysobacter sp. TY2-98 TaxID=2290922 RepID=UPI000E207D5B|nr:glycosyltransferase family 2 protein [Lysobacter sp. TY2-98]AXK73050.1 glycosyltransferase family 2 protein [Lysobacter sp. TY2-98]
MAEPISARDVAIVIPALNEELRIRDVVEGALAHCPNVILIDDGSDDATVERVSDLPITVIRHATRMGKGAGLRDGFAEAMRRGFRGVISMDGDGQHAAEDIPRLLDAANVYPDHIVIGARLRKRARQPTYRRIANEFGDWGIAWGCGFRLADSQSGQRFYPASVCALGVGDIPGEDFVYEAQMLISASRKLGVRCVSVPIESRYQADTGPVKFRKSHFRPLRDLWRITSHVVVQVFAYGNVMAEYRRTRSNPVIIHDPSGEFAPNAVAAPAHSG